MKLLILFWLFVSLQNCVDKHSRIGSGQLRAKERTTKQLNDSASISHFERAHNWYYTVPQDSVSNISKKSNFKDSIVHLIDFLPDGAKVDGSQDYTTHIQNVIDEYERIMFPPFPILVNDLGLRIPSNRMLMFPPGSKIVLKPTEKPNYRIFLIEDSENISLIGPEIIGDRYNHLGKEGEWGMGIAIFSSKNIEIVNAVVLNCWGDGIYIGQRNENKTVPSDIFLKNVRCLHNRRNGISIISVNGLRLEESELGFSNGTIPKAGLDIEPNKPYNQIKNVIIKGLKTFQNEGPGISLYLNKLHGNDGANEIDVRIVKHSDISSNTGISISMQKPRSSKNLHGRIKGIISISQSDWRDSRSLPLNINVLPDAATIKIGNSFIRQENDSMNVKSYMESLKSTIPKTNVVVE